MQQKGVKGPHVLICHAIGAGEEAPPVSNNGLLKGLGRHRTLQVSNHGYTLALGRCAKDECELVYGRVCAEPKGLLGFGTRAVKRNPLHTTS